MKRYSTFDGNWDIWGWVYGIPSAIGLALILFGSEAAAGFGALLITSCIGSFALISFLDWVG